MPTKDYTEILAGIKAEWITHQELADNEIRIFIELPKTPHICPACNATTNRIKDYYTRKICHTSCDDTPVLLLYKHKLEK